MLRKQSILKRLNNDINLILLNQVDSTNSYAKRDNRNEYPKVVIAKKQTGGRGRLGRSFISKKGGLYLSYVTDTLGADFNAGLITACAAVAAAKAIDEVCGIECGIKWVNDIYINNKKVCGILTEGFFTNNNTLPDKIIIGIGINITRNFATKEIKNIATALNKECKKKIDINTLAACIINNLEDGLKNIDKLEFLDGYRNKSIVVGKEIKILQNNDCYVAKALRIEDDCSLTVMQNGIEKNINFGEISIKI